LSATAEYGATMLFRKPAPEPFDAAEAVRRQARGAVVLFDIRDADEVRATGRAAGAVVVSLDDFARRLAPLSADPLPGLASGLPVALYCRSGMRSGRAAQMLRALGIEPVANIGGLDDWIAAGGPTEPGP
jgi:rhodanese-related sulfurtransferase